MFAHRFLQSHPEIDVADYITAATTRLPNAELWTLDVRHFPMFPGLNPPYCGFGARTGHLPVSGAGGNARRSLDSPRP